MGKAISMAASFGLAALALAAGAASVKSEKQEAAGWVAKATAPLPSGERKVFGYELEKPEVALTKGKALVELAAAEIENESVVDENGAGVAKLKLRAKTSLGMLSYELEAKGQEGVEFAAIAQVNGKPIETNVRIAKKEGCVQKSCPAAIRSDFLSEWGVSVDVYSPARK